MGKNYSAREKEAVFIQRTKEKYPNVWKHYTTHISHELMTFEQLKRYNFAQRQAIVRYAYENTAFYRELYRKAGFHPDDLQTEEDWNRIPIVTKQMIRDNFEAMIVGGEQGELARKYGKKLFTGGSTGTPVPIMRDMRFEQAGSTVWRSRGWWMNRPLGELTGNTPVLGQDEATVWRMVGVNVKTAEEREEEKKLYAPMRRYYLDAQNMSEENMASFIKELNESESGVFLQGYTGALIELAEFCIKNHLECRPRALYGISTPMDIIGRRILGDAFHCEIFDVYGSSECQNMAHECPQSEHHLHVLTDLRHIDILNEDGTPVEGEQEGIVHATSFTNYIAPLIRFNLNDRAHWIQNRCRCGLPFPLMSRIAGRESYQIVGKSGKKFFAPEAKVYLEADHIQGFQFVDYGMGNVTVKIIPNLQSPDHMEAVNRIKTALISQFSDEIDFRFELVDSIPHKGGKHFSIVHENVSKLT